MANGIGADIVSLATSLSWITELDRVAPEWLTRVIAHELLVKADFARRAGKP
jgi:hypothetical protein